MASRRGQGSKPQKGAAVGALGAHVHVAKLCIERLNTPLSIAPAYALQGARMCICMLLAIANSLLR